MQEIAARMVAIDRERALAASALLAWEASGKAPELVPIKPGDLPWVFLASLEELHAMAREVVRLSPQAARALWVGLESALEAHEQALQDRYVAG